MSLQRASAQHTVNATPPSPRSLPDLNVETNPFEIVQRVLDQAACFNMIAVPDPKHSPTLMLARGSSRDIIGMAANENLHRFNAIVQSPTFEKGLTATNCVGEAAGTFSLSWQIIPDEYVALPGKDSPATRMDPSRSQRFVMLDERFTFSNGEDSFHGFGAGRTYPLIVGGQSQLLVGAVGNIMQGFGKFKDHIGTYVLNGTMTSSHGFLGNITCRVLDPDGNLSIEDNLPPLEPIPNPDPAVTYIVLWGQKRDRTERTTFIIKPDGQVGGLNTPGQMHSVHLDFAMRRPGDLRSETKVGQAVGTIQAAIRFNPLDPGAPGTALAPIPFQTEDFYTFFDRRGQTIGTIIGQITEGRTFNLTLPGLPGQPALRFGGVGPLEEGTGRLSGAKGMSSVNSAVGIAPHTLSLLHVLRIIDPESKFRAALHGY